MPYFLSTNEIPVVKSLKNHFFCVNLPKNRIYLNLYSYFCLPKGNIDTMITKV